MKRFAFAFVFLTSALAQTSEPTPTPPVDSKIDFKVRLLTKGHEFRIGEIIPVELSFRSRLKRGYQITQSTYDRSGRMNYEDFVVKPADGAEDPLAEYFRIARIGGGFSPADFLSAKSWTIKLNLNEWVRFTKPGDYKVRVSSHRVDRIDRSSAYGTSPVTATSNEIALKILSRDSAWEKRICDEAVATLNKPASFQRDKNWDSKARQAFEILRYLGTVDAARALVNQLGRKTSEDFKGDCYFGIVYSPERAAACDALEAALAEPDRPIDDNFIDVLGAVEKHGDTNEATSSEVEKKLLEKIARVLPDKQPDVFLPSLYSLSNYFWVRGGKLLSKDTVDELMEQLLANFDRLTPEQKEHLLDWRWEYIKRPALVPLLKRYAEQDSSDWRDDIHYNTRTLAALALRRWYELDPVGARPAIISEMSRAKPRFGVRELGLLPDKTLPEVDRLLAEHIHGDEDFETASRIVSLITRYGTREILPQVLQKLDPNIGKWNPALQNPLLGYVLRVDPASARPRIEKAMMARDNQETYSANLLSEIAAIHYDPFLEELALRALKNKDDRIASSAIGLLTNFGSSDAEAALWDRYEKWCKRWAGREPQLNLEAVPAHFEQEGGRDNIGMGQSLVRAIANGHRWLTDESKLQKLMAMSKVPTIRFQLELYLEKWRQPVSVSFFSCAEQSPGLSASVAHYELNSLEELKEKLAQFPAGTKFELSLPAEGEDQSCVDDLRAFLADHQFSTVDWKPREEN